MVSTRGGKVKFYEGEKVLCYEPDPTKAKVLYESKVKDVIASKSKKSVEYLIHFRGWNSSWDRCVNEEYILKDTPENRQLQKDLAEKSKLQFGAYLYRKERKKHGRKNSERTSSTSDCNRDTDSRDSSSEEESSIDDYPVILELTSDLRQYLEHDYYIVSKSNRLHKIPAVPNVVTILESYWRFYSTNQLCSLHDRGNGKNNKARDKLRADDVKRNLNICQEVLDGIRIYFDFTLQELLLYNNEIGQIEMGQAISLWQHKIKSDRVKDESEDQEYAHLPIMEDDICSDSHHDNSNNHSVSRRRSLRSYRSLDTNATCGVNSTAATDTCGQQLEHNPKSISSSNSSCTGEMCTSIKIPSWKVLPDYIYSQRPPPPCLLYGATHLTRLFVKLPELLSSTNMPEDKLKLLLTHLESFIDFLSDRKEWFTDKCYTDATI